MSVRRRGGRTEGCGGRCGRFGGVNRSAAAYWLGVGVSGVGILGAQDFAGTDLRESLLGSLLVAVAEHSEGVRVVP